MRFESVLARAFGPLVDATLDLAPGMNLVHGPNEAGKSTWHAALYAGLCGRRRGQGKLSSLDQLFRDRHRPWDGSRWEVGVIVRLEHGQRIELRHDLGGNVNCRATDADLGRDVSAEIMHQGSPDGSKFLGLDRRAFLATACVRQADLLGVCEDPDLLQEHLQRAAATSGADATASAALSRIQAYRRDYVGVDQANAVKPLRRALDAVRAAELALGQARIAHELHLQLAEQVEVLRNEAELAALRCRALRSRLAEREAERARQRAERAAVLAADFPHGAPAGVADGESLAQDVAAALRAWSGAPAATPLVGDTAEELGQQLAELPEMPDGDLEPDPAVVQAAQNFRDTLAQVNAHEDVRPQMVARPNTGGSTELELRDLARGLSTPLPAVDPAAQVRYDRAQQNARDTEAAGGGSGRGMLAAGGLVAVAGALVAVAGYLAPGLALIGLGIGLVLWQSLRGSGSARARAAALQELKDAGDALGGQKHALDQARSRRAAALSRTQELRISADPNGIARLAEQLDAATAYEREAARWDQRRARLAGEHESATSALRLALAARGVHVNGALTDAVRDYQEGCVERGRIARAAARRPDLAQRSAERLESERLAAEQTARHSVARDRLREVAARCGVEGNAEETLVAGLEDWLGRAREELRQRELAARCWTELQGLLDGRNLEDLVAEARAKADTAARLGDGLPPDLLASLTVEEDGEAQVEQLRRAESAAMAAFEQKRGQLTNSGQSGLSVPEAEEAVAAAQRELARVRELDRILGLTHAYLSSAQDRAHRDIAPRLAAAVARRLPRVTDGRYVEVRLDPATLDVGVRTPANEWRRAALLSHGTAEQVYLLLRVALAEHLTRATEVCPLVLDDVTAQADSERTLAILDVLHEISQERQVILFSQEDEVLNWADAHLSTPRDAIRRLGTRQPVGV